MTIALPRSGTAFRLMNELSSIEQAEFHRLYNQSPTLALRYLYGLDRALKQTAVQAKIAAPEYTAPGMLAAEIRMGGCLLEWNHHLG